MAFEITGVSVTGGEQDEDGYVNYDVEFTMVSLNTLLDGPATALSCPDLPQPYALYDMAQFRGFGSEEVDLYSWCHWKMEAKPLYKPEERGIWYKVMQHYGSKPEKRCRVEPVQDPVLEPPVITGNTSKYTQEAIFDRFNNAIVNSAHEQIRGPQNEWDNNRISIKIKTNMATAWLGYILPMQLVDYVNSTPMWGLPPRTIKLSSATWELKFSGPCEGYYERTLEFDINVNTWDRDLIDEGTKVLGAQGSTWNGTQGTWNPLPIPGYSGMPNPNPLFPSHFVRSIDRNGNPWKIVLNGAGLPFDPLTVTTCDQCQNPLIYPPLVWQIQGLDFTTLTYDSGCSWTATSASLGPVTLSFNADNMQWSLFASEAVKEWTNDGWNCEGPNTMTAVDGDTVPQFVYLQSAQAGTIHVEYYPESDFTALLLPANF